MKRSVALKCTISHQLLKTLQSIRLKNQFRSLDDDEVDFLDSVLESTRAKDAAIKKDTIEQLDAFRIQQEEAERSILVEENDAGLPGLEEKWLVGGRKRKKGRDNEVQRAVKLQKTSSTAADHVQGATAKMLARTQIQRAPVPQHNDLKGKQIAYQPQDVAKLAIDQQDALVPRRNTSVAPPLPGLGLGAYSSDDD